MMKNSDTLVKTCSKCGDIYPATKEFFCKDASKKDGLRPECRACNKLDRTLAYYRKKSKRYYKTTVGHLTMIYAGMKQRCGNKRAHNYKRYGGRGIKCKFKSRSDFTDYVLKEIYGVVLNGLQVDRIDNDGDYEPGNIRFVTAKENCGNRGGKFK